MFKYASATLYDPRIAQPGDHRRRTAHRVEFDYDTRPGYLYVRSRMISSRCNDNWDEFTPEEIKGDGKSLGYVTFVGKPVFVNHHNEDHRRARGIILDAKLHEDRNPDGSPDTWVEGLMEVDAVRFPKLAKAILAGEIDRTSMGVDVERSQCSKCANVATTPLEYCRHIPAMKGSRIRMVTASGQPVSHLVRERCFGLRFFENSLLVEEPADPTAVVLDRPYMSGDMFPRFSSLDGVNHGTGNTESFTNVNQGELPSSGSPLPSGSQRKKAADSFDVFMRQASSRVVGTAQASSASHHVGGVHGVAPGDPVNRVLAGSEVAGVPDNLAGPEWSHQLGVTPPMGTHRRASLVGQDESPVARVEEVAGPRPAHTRASRGVDLGPPALQFGSRALELSSSCRPADHDAYFITHTASRREPPKETTLDIKVGVRRCAVCHSADTVAFDNLNECLACTAIRHITAESSLMFEAGKAAPGGQHKFFDENPVHHANVIDHWNQATDDEKDQGKRWYGDAHLITKAMATLHTGPEHPRGNVHLAAGLVGNYSPQTPWDANKHNAARVLHENRARGGEGEGIMATTRQKVKAQRMLDGESHEDVISPKAHKVQAFTHLVEHGGDADPSKPRVCVDRHALSVATGKRMSDDDYGAFPKASKQHYDHVASTFHEASKHISDAEGEHVPPHAVQATTWLVRQRLNQRSEHDQAGQAGAGGAAANQDRLNKGRTKSRGSSTDKWEKFRNEHLPGAEDNASTGYSDAQERLKSQNEDDEGEGGAPKPYRRKTKPKAASRQGSPDFR